MVSLPEVPSIAKPWELFSGSCLPGSELNQLCLEAGAGRASLPAGP